MSANGDPTTSGFEDLNGNAVVVAGEGRLRTGFFGLTGHQLFGTSFSNKKFTSIDQRFKVTIGQGPLGLLSRLNRKSIGTGTILGLRLQLVF